MPGIRLNNSFLNYSDTREEGRELLKLAEEYMSKLNNSTTIFSALKRLVEDTDAWEQVWYLP